MAANPSVKNSSIWMVTLSISEKAFSFFIYILLARFLDILEFGIVAFCILFIEFLTMLINTGVREYIVTRKEVSKLFINTCFFSIMGVAVVVVAIFFQIFTLFIPEDASPLLKEVFEVLIFLPLFSSFNTIQIALLQRDFAFKQLAIRTFISTLIGGSAAATFAYFGYGAWALVINKYLIVIVNMLILLYVSRFIPSCLFSVDIFKACYKFSIPLILSEILNFVSSRIMQLFVSIFFGPASFAILDIARKFSNLIQQVSLTALRPICLSHVTKTEPNKRGAVFSEFSATITFLVAPAFLLLGIYADSYVILVFGPKWDQAIQIIEILSFGAIATCLTWYFAVPLIVNNETKRILQINIVFLLISVFGGFVALYLSFPQYIMVQIAFVNLISALKLLYLLRTKKISGYDVKSQLLPVFASLCFFAFITLSIKRMIFIEIKFDNLFDLGLIVVLSVTSIVLYFIFSFIMFRTFSKNILTSIISIKN